MGSATDRTFPGMSSQTWPGGPSRPRGVARARGPNLSAGRDVTRQGEAVRGPSVEDRLIPWPHDTQAELWGVKAMDKMTGGLGARGRTGLSCWPSRQSWRSCRVRSSRRSGRQSTESVALRFLSLATAARPERGAGRERHINR
jgi:hypothetical protein